MKNLLKIAVFWGLLLGGLVFAFTGQPAFAQNMPGPEETNVHAKGRVLEIEKSIKEAGAGGEITPGGTITGTYEEQTLKVEVLSGEDKGEIVTIPNDVYGNPMDIEAEVGDAVFLIANVQNGVRGQYFVMDYWHSRGIIIWTVIFVLIVLAVGGKAGVKALLSLGGSIFLIFAVLIPSIEKGYDPVLITVFLCVIIIVMTHLIITGTNRKSWAAMGGTIGGVICAVLLTYIVGNMAGLTGLGTEESRILALYRPDFDYRSILFAGIIFGALGAVMDIAMSISSGLQEIKEHQPNIKRAALIKSGMTIGRDVMGSMLNTLIFAYIGASMIAIILHSLLQTNITEMLNYGEIAEEAARSLVGTMGLLLTIPLTALLGGFMIVKKK